MAFTRTYDEDEPQRVNKWLAQSGVCSRREAEALIADGLVSIDGEVVEDVGRKILTGQTLVLADRATNKLDSSLTVMIHKPVGIVSSQPDPGQVPAVRLLKRETLWAHEAVIPNFSNRLAPVGRLDMDSRGLLLMSEDGEKLELMRFGLELDGRELRPAQVEMISDQRIRVVLQEGRNRQIRRMCELLEWKVVDLFRVRVGPITLGDMPEGCWRPLTAEERAALIAA
jgi:23S rRNA pseudouridine2604 synthase